MCERGEEERKGGRENGERTREGERHSSERVVKLPRLALPARTRICFFFSSSDVCSSSAFSLRVIAAVFRYNRLVRFARERERGISFFLSSFSQINWLFRGIGPLWIDAETAACPLFTHTYTRSYTCTAFSAETSRYM